MSNQETTNYADYVDPFIGTSNSLVEFTDLASHFSAGNVFPGAKVPWGLATANPRNTMEIAWNGKEFGKNVTGYLHGEPYFHGYSQLHLSGVGCHDWGNFIVMPVNGKPSANVEKRKSAYSAEKASAGYYSTFLDDYDILTEVTATRRSTLSKFTFKQASDSAHVIFDLFYNLTVSTDAYVNIVSGTEIEGWNKNGGFCGSWSNQQVFFYARFSKPAMECGILTGDTLLAAKKVNHGPASYAAFRFQVEDNEPVMLKLGISFISIENAKENLMAEQPGWDFNGVKQAAHVRWDKELSKIKVYGGSKKDRIIFYTALYRSLMHPNVFQDVDGKYLTMENKEVKTLPEGQENQYTVFSLWDTYRTLHPLLTLVYPGQQSDMVKTMVDHYQESGFLPKWELAANEARIMVGDPAGIVIADTYLKGIRDFDVQTAYQAMKKNATLTDSNLIRDGMQQYTAYGYIPDDMRGRFDTLGGEQDRLWGSVSTSLEYYLSDYCLAKLAGELGYEKDSTYFYERSLGYKNLFNPKTGFLQPRDADGSWHEPFYPDTLMGEFPGNWPGGGRGYVEGNAWQYLFFVPHDIQGLVALMGKETLVEKLQSTFEVPGRFELFNEPDIAYPFLFNYIEGEEWRTQEEVRNALDKYYITDPGGWPGNDDAGTLSAWYVFAAMGFYPDCPGKPGYSISSPAFDKVVIDLNAEYYKGKKFTIVTRNNSDENKYIQSLKLNGKPLKGFRISHHDIVQGGSLEFELGNSK